MKLNNDQKRRLEEEKAGQNYEILHFTYDEMMKKRLLELDPEFVHDLDAAVAGVDFGFT